MSRLDHKCFSNWHFSSETMVSCKLATDQFSKSNSEENKGMALRDNLQSETEMVWKEAHVWVKRSLRRKRITLVWPICHQAWIFASKSCDILSHWSLWFPKAEALCLRGKQIIYISSCNARTHGGVMKRKKRYRTKNSLAIGQNPA